MKDLKNFLFGLPLYQKIFLLIIVFLFLFWLVRLAFVPVWDYDSIAYHMPFVANFIQKHTVNDIYFSALSGPIGYYPSNMEVLLTNFLLFFNFDSSLNALNLLFAFGLFLGFYLICRELNASKTVTFLGFFALFSMPVFLRLIGTLKIDVFFLFLFAALSLFLIRYLKTQSFADIFLFSLSSGLFLGSRYLAIPYVLLPLCIIFTFFIVRFVAGWQWRFATHFEVLILGILITGGYWYIRNFIAVNNPIYPTPVSFLGKKIFEGLGGSFSKELFSTSIISNFISPDIAAKIFGDYFIETGLALLLIAVFFVFLIAFLKNDWFKNRFSFEYFKKILLYCLFLIGVPLYLYFYISSPNSFVHLDQNIRYSLPALFLGVLMTIFIVFSGESNKLLKDAVAGLLILTIAANIFIFFAFPKPQMVLGAKIMQPLASRDAFYQKLEQTYSGFERILSVMQWMDKNIPQNAKIGYSGFHFHYPLFGQSLTREVNYITVNECHHCNYDNYQFSEGNIFVNPSFNAWLGNLCYYQTQYYVFYNQMGSPEPEKNWLKENPQSFELLYNIEGAAVYKINLVRNFVSNGIK